MSQSLAEILVHVVFSTKDREPWLVETFRSQVFAYLAEVGRDSSSEILRVGGTADHVHLAMRLGRSDSVAERVKRIKQASSVWIKEHGENHAGFAWQAGYGAFSIGASQLPALIRYIEGQEEHHRRVSFQEEYRNLLRKYGVSFDERYVWD